MDSSVAETLEEFVLKRCEEILFCDEKYRKLSNYILNTETEFKKSLTSDQRKEYSQIEELNMESIAHVIVIAYNTCLSDIQSIRKTG